MHSATRGVDCQAPLGTVIHHPGRYGGVGGKG